MEKIYYIFAQGLLAMLSPLIVMVEARHDHAIAAMISVGLSVVGAFYSLFYFGLNPYISLNGFRNISIEHAILFRLINALLSGMVSLLLCYALHVSLYITLVVIFIKMSEAVIDLWVGLSTFTFGSISTAKTYLKISTLRTLFILLIIYLCGITNSNAYQMLLLLLFTFIACIYFLFQHLNGKYYLIQFRHFSLKKYYKYAHLMSQFFLATAICAVINALPRWLIKNVDSAENYVVDAISLSIVPVLGLIFQSLWFSTINKISINFDKTVKIFAFQILILSMVLYATYPIWDTLIQFFYHLNLTSEIDRFKQMASVAILYFAAMTMQNVFKAFWPIGEAWGYIISALTLVTLTMQFHLDMIISLLISAFTMIAYVCLILIYKSRFTLKVYNQT